MKKRKKSYRDLERELTDLKKEQANKVDIIAKTGNELLFETGQDLASAECMVMMLKDLVWQVAKKEIYPHELKRWLEQFEAQADFKGTHEELLDRLGLTNLNRDYDEIYLAVEKRIASRLLDLNISHQLSK